MVDIVTIKNDVYFITDEIYRLENCSNNIIETIYKIKDGCIYKETKNELGSEKADELITVLKELNILRENNINDFRGQITERQVLYFDSITDSPNKMQKNIQSKRVCILGMGGIGSVVFQHLIGAGVKSFILIDSDKVEIHNLNRQYIYRSVQLGKLKVKCAKEYAHNVDESIKIKTYSNFIEKIDDLKFLDDKVIDFFICAADLPANKISTIVNKYCMKKNIPSFFISVGINSGTWGPLVIPYKTYCYDCFCKKEDELCTDLELELREKINPITKASFGPTNTIISTFSVKDIILFLGGYKEIKSINTRFSFDFINMKIKRFSVEGCCNC